MRSSVGDVDGACEQLKRALKRARFTFASVEPRGRASRIDTAIKSGSSRIFIPALRHALCERSKHALKRISDRGHDLIGVETPMRFVERAFRATIDVFGYKPKVSARQFVSDGGFAVAKMTTVMDVLAHVETVHIEREREIRAEAEAEARRKRVVAPTLEETLFGRRRSATRERQHHRRFVGDWRSSKEDDAFYDIDVRREYAAVEEETPSETSSEGEHDAQVLLSDWSDVEDATRDALRRCNVAYENVVYERETVTPTSTPTVVDEDTVTRLRLTLAEVLGRLARLEKELTLTNAKCSRLERRLEEEKRDDETQAERNVNGGEDTDTTQSFIHRYRERLHARAREFEERE